MMGEPVELIKALELYQKGDYAQAYTLSTIACEQYPDWKSRAYEFRFDIAAVMGKLDLAEDILNEALDQGFFYNELVLRQDDDVKELQGRPRFEELARRSLKVLQEVQDKARPDMKIIEPDPMPTGRLPLLMGLHGNNSRVEEFSDYWNSLQYDQWLVALPQSSQVSAKNQFVWNDFTRIEIEIASLYAQITSYYSIDAQKSILAGFSKGGHAAIHCALKGLVPVRGFLGLASFVRDPGLILPLLDQPWQKDLRGYFILGEIDDTCTPGALKLVDLLQAHQIECRVEIVPGMAHDIPVDFAPYLKRAIDFILQKQD